MKTQFFPSPKSEASLYELHRALNGGVAINGEENVEVIRHDDEFVQTEFVLRAVVVENPDEESGRPFGLEHGTFSGDGRSDEEGTGIGSYARWSGIAERDRHGSG